MSYPFIQIANACKLDDYYAYENETKSGTRTGSVDCTRSCTDLCEKMVFNIMQRRISNIFEQTAQLTISIKSFQYPIFEEKLKWNQETFLGAFGGIVGLFLGLDFFKIFMYTYILLIFLYKKYRQKKEERTENENPATENDQEMPKGQIATISREKLQSESRGWSLTRLTNRAKRWRWKHDLHYTAQSTRLKIIKWLASNAFKISLVI